MEAHRIDVAEVTRRLDADEPLLFLDTRSPSDWERADRKVTGAMRVPADDVANHLDAIPRDRTIITYCS